MKSRIPLSVHLLAIGLNYRSAPLALRETVAFNDGQLIAALAALKTRFDTEAVILSTCNRVECYMAASAGADATPPTIDDLITFLADFHHVPVAELRSHMVGYEGRTVVEHLFDVTSSLDSIVVGETQILAQVKHAYLAACDANAVGKIFHALFQRALAAAKEVLDQTRLAAGRVSIASVAVELATSVFDRFDDKTVLCIGAGKMATQLLRSLTDLHPQKLVIANRSVEKARALAYDFSKIAGGTDACSLEELDKRIVEADIILTGTGAATPLITEERFKSLLKARRYRPIVIVDIAVPRNVEPSVGNLNNVYLYNVDDLQEVAAGNRSRRDTEIVASRTLLTEHTDNFYKWFLTRDVGPLVKSLYEQCHALARTELDAVFTKAPDMSEDQRKDLERLAHRLIGKLLHNPVTRLTNGENPELHPLLTMAMKELFNLHPSADEARFEPPTPKRAFAD